MRPLFPHVFRRLIRLVAVGVIGLVLVVVAEVVLAFRVERIEGFTVEELDRSIGAPPRIRMLWIGDSTAAGVGASTPERSVPLRVAVALDRGVQTEVRAVSGARIADALATQTVDLPRALDLVIVGIGANDVTHLTSRARVREGMRALLSRVREAEPMELVVLGVPNFGGSPLLAQPLRWLAGVRSRQIDAVVREVAAEFGATYVPIAALTHAGFAADPRGTHASDGFHPSDAGYGLWVDAITSTLESEGVFARLRDR